MQYRNRARPFVRVILAVALGMVSAQSGAQTAAGGRIPLDASGQPVPSLAPMIKRVSPAVVNIATRGTVTERAPRNPLLEDPFFRRFFETPEEGPRQRHFQSAGSGVVIDAKQGLVITNAHVIEHASDITVTTLDGRDYAADVVGADTASDVAVVRVKNAKLTEVALGDSGKAEVGDFVVAIGNPFGLQHTVTFGIVSALSRSGINPEGYEDFIQTDASINPGNSGGALVNLRGELIGINSAILSGGGGNIGIGFAIPSNMAKSVVDQLIKYGSVKRGILGVNVVTLTPDYADNLGLKDQQGALVSQVVQGSAADQAGIKAGDVITSVNGQSVKTGAELRNRIGLLRIGEVVDIGLLHDGKAKHVSATVQARTESDVTTGAEFHRALEGAELADTPGGVVVRSVGPATPANQLGLHPQDQIAQVNRDRVANLQELRAAMKGQGSLILTVRRGNAIILIPLR
jgi:Do/DeqQ family serine protease